MPKIGKVAEVETPPRRNLCDKVVITLYGEGSIAVADIGKAAVMSPGSSTCGMLTTDFV